MTSSQRPASSTDAGQSAGAGLGNAACCTLAALQLSSTAEAAPRRRACLQRATRCADSSAARGRRLLCTVAASVERPSGQCLSCRLPQQAMPLSCQDAARVPCVMPLLPLPHDVGAIGMRSCVLANVTFVACCSCLVNNVCLYSPLLLSWSLSCSSPVFIMYASALLWPLMSFHTSTMVGRRAPTNAADASRAFRLGAVLTGLRGRPGNRAWPITVPAIRQAL